MEKQNKQIHMNASTNQQDHGFQCAEKRTLQQMVNWQQNVIIFIFIFLSHESLINNTQKDELARLVNKDEIEPAIWRKNLNLYVQLRCAELQQMLNIAGCLCQPNKKTQMRDLVVFVFNELADVQVQEHVCTVEGEICKKQVVSRLKTVYQHTCRQIQSILTD